MTRCKQVLDSGHWGVSQPRVMEGIIGWLTGKLSLHAYFPLELTVNVARQ